MKTKNQARQRRTNKKHTAILLASELILLGATFNVHCMESNKDEFLSQLKQQRSETLIEEDPARFFLESSFENFDSLPEQVVVEFGD